MHSLQEQAIKLAHHFGRDEGYVRAGGGNVSAKHDGVLHIKPSGLAMSEIGVADLVPLRLAPLLQALHLDPNLTGDPVRQAAAQAQIGNPERRPSVELLFHALIPDPLVLHLHPLLANALTCNRDGARLCQELLSDRALWVDYLAPGVPLAFGIQAARANYSAHTKKPAPAITLLGNHGIIVSGGSADEVAEQTHWLTQTVRSALDPLPCPPNPKVDLGALSEAFRAATDSIVAAASSEGVASSASQLEAAPVSLGPLIPDQIVYAGSLPVILDLADDLTQVRAKVHSHRAEHGRLPIVAVVPERGVIATGPGIKSAEIALKTFLDALQVARDADRLGQVRVLDARQRRFIETWEAESYRKSVSVRD